MHAADLLIMLWRIQSFLVYFLHATYEVMEWLSSWRICVSIVFSSKETVPRLSTFLIFFLSFWKWEDQDCIPGINAQQLCKWHSDTSVFHYCPNDSYNCLAFSTAVWDVVFRKPSIRTPKSFMSVNSLFRVYLSIVTARAVSFPACLTNIRFHLLLYCSESWAPSAMLCSHVPD